MDIMLPSPPDHQAVVDATRTAARRYCALLLDDLDPQAQAVGSWSVTDVATHVGVLLDVVSQLLAGRPSPYGDLDTFGDRSQQLIEAYAGDRSLAALAERTEQETTALLDDIADQPGDREIVWHAGIRLPLVSLTAIWLGEFTVHGYDIATANTRPWPLDAEHARLIFAGALPVLPHYVDRNAAAGVRATYELRLRGAEPVRLRFDDAALTIMPPDGGRVECYLAGDPRTFLLVSYGRANPTRAVLTGRVRAWGRRPWLGFRFSRLLRSP